MSEVTLRSGVGHAIQEKPLPVYTGSIGLPWSAGRQWYLMRTALIAKLIGSECWLANRPSAERKQYRVTTVLWY